MRKRKWFKKTTSMIIALAMVLSLSPSSAFADETPESGTEITTEEQVEVETTEESVPVEDVTTEAATVEAGDNSTEVTTEITTEVETVETTEETTTEELTTETVTEEENITEEIPAEPVPTFTHVYGDVNVDGKDFSSCELLIVTGDSSIFTADTEVVSEYNGVYLTRFPDATQTMYAYTYYYHRAELVEVNTSFRGADEMPEGQSSEDTESEDDGDVPQQTEAETPAVQVEELPNEGHGEADLSGINSGSDAFSNTDNMPTRNYSGYIALIDSGSQIADASVSVIGSTSDDNGHGTKMARRMKEANPGCKILSIKALDSSATGSVSDIYAAIKYAIDANVSVINLSISTPGSSSLVASAVSEAISKGITVVAAAGNNGKNASLYTPGNIPGVITVGACDADGKRQSFSNYGSTVNYYIQAKSTSEAAAIFSANLVTGKSADEFAIAGKDIETSEEELSPDIADYTREELEHVKELQGMVEDIKYKGAATYGDFPNSFTADADFFQTAATGHSFTGTVSGLRNISDATVAAVYQTDDAQSLEVWCNCAGKNHRPGGCADPGYGSHTLKGTTFYFHHEEDGWLYYYNDPCAADDLYHANGYQQMGYSIRFRYHNEPKPKYGAIQVLKVNEDNEPVGGATFLVTGPNGYSKTVTTSFNASNEGLATVTNLSAGTYTVKETAAPSTYQTNNQSFTVNINLDTAYSNEEKSYAYVFDAKPYLAINGDVSSAGYNTSNAWQHWWNAGWDEGRKTTYTFNVKSYQARYSSELSSVGAAFNHYCDYGADENRKTLSDAEYAALAKNSVTGSSTSVAIVKVEDKHTESFLTLKKSSSNTSYTNNNPNYSLAGAEYKVFKTAAAAQSAISSRNFSASIGTLTTDASGNTSALNVTNNMNKTDGTIINTQFYVVESKAPKNYQMDRGVHPVTVTTANTKNNPAVVSVTDVPINDPIRIQVKKAFAENTTVTDKALEGAIFTLKYYPLDISQNYTFAELQSKTPTITKTYETKKLNNGLIATEINELFPLGYITLEETKAPDGFVIKDSDMATVNGHEASPKMAFVLTGTGDATIGYQGSTPYYIDNTGRRTIEIASDATVFNEAIVPNDMGRADIKWLKYHDRTEEPVEGAEFEIKNAETGESTTVVTDADGAFSTESSYRSHAEGVWFKEGKQGAQNETPDDTLGALPLGTYIITETKAPEGMQLEEPITVNLTRDGEVVTVYDSGRTDNVEIISDMDISTIGTKALVETADGEMKMLPAAPGQIIHDICEYNNLRYNTDYTLLGQLMEIQPDGSVIPFTREDGSEVKGVAHFTTPDTYTYSKYDACGTVTVEFADLDFTGKEGISYVVFERLYYGDITEEDIEQEEFETNYPNSNNKTEFPLIHEDPEDENQTVEVPDGHTTALSEDKTKTVTSVEGPIVINDTVEYTGLEPGREYEVSGKLYVRPENDAEDKEYTDEELEKIALKDKNGDFVTASTTFTAEERDGSVVVTFTFDAELTTESQSIVAFEDCKDIGTDITVFTHADIHDNAQTVYKPVIRTKAKGTENRSELLYTDGKFRDEVFYDNLEPESKYILTGLIMDKSSGQELLLDGRKITASAEFTTGKATNADGSVAGSYELEFSLDEKQIKELEGKSIVVFELLQNSALTTIAKHNDINDKGQELTIPKIKTTLLDDKTKEHVAYPDEIVNLTDTVRYENLIPGKKYKMSGVLMNKKENKALLDENGKEIKGETEFTADKTGSGIVEVKFTFNAKLLKLQGESIVAFEDCIPTDGTIPVGTHMDIEDQDQTVDLPKVGTKVSKSDWTSKDTISLTDTIAYSNLMIKDGYKYIAKGWLVDSSGNKVTVNGKEIYKEVEFTPTSKDGTVDVKFDDFSAAGLNGNYVVFEEVYVVVPEHKDETGKTISTSTNKVGEHKDLTDKDQTITVTPKPGVPKTGMTIFFIILTVMIISGIGMFIFKRRTRV